MGYKEIDKDLPGGIPLSPDTPSSAHNSNWHFGTISSELYDPHLGIKLEMALEIVKHYEFTKEHTPSNELYHVSRKFLEKNLK